MINTSLPENKLILEPKSTGQTLFAFSLIELAYKKDISFQFSKRNESDKNCFVEVHKSIQYFNNHPIYRYIYAGFNNLN